MNYNNRPVSGESNSANGKVSESTRVYYYQDADRVWAKHSGGEIVSTHLQVMVFADGSIEFMYHHENIDGELMAGKCRSTPHQSPGGKLILKENWQWFTGDQTTGMSELEEVVES